MPRGQGPVWDAPDVRGAVTGRDTACPSKAPPWEAVLPSGLTSSPGWAPSHRGFLGNRRSPGTWGGVGGLKPGQSSGPTLGPPHHDANAGIPETGGVGRGTNHLVALAQGTATSPVSCPLPSQKPAPGRAHKLAPRGAHTPRRANRSVRSAHSRAWILVREACLFKRLCLILPNDGVPTGTLRGSFIKLGQGFVFPILICTRVLRLSGQETPSNRDSWLPVDIHVDLGTFVAD